MIDFCGWEMPLQYRGVIHEHTAVRKNAGLFDVSHMGRINIEGPDAEDLLNYLSTNEISNKSIGSATYTVWCNESGQSLDDLIIYKESASKFFIIVNACNREKDLVHLRHYAEGKKVIIEDRYQTDGILAIQGPKSEKIILQLFKEVQSLKPMHFLSLSYQGRLLVLSRTGYTGEVGFEIYAPSESIVSLWELFLKEGSSEGIEPAGLGVRDILRLEMGYALYGHELNETMTPLESVSAWTIKWQKSDFLGKSALEKLKTSHHHHFQAGIIMKDRAIPREGYEVFQEGKLIGKVTSGTFSPSLGLGIAIVLVERNLLEGDSVEVRVRENFHPAKVVPLPFKKQSEA